MDHLITYNGKQYYWDATIKKVKEVILRDVDLRDCPPKLLEELLGVHTKSVHTKSVHTKLCAQHFHNHKPKKPCAAHPFVCHPHLCCAKSCPSYKKYINRTFKHRHDHIDHVNP